MEILGQNLSFFAMLERRDKGENKLRKIQVDWLASCPQWADRNGKMS